MGKYKIKILSISNPIEINFIIKSLALLIVHKNLAITQNNQTKKHLNKIIKIHFICKQTDNKKSKKNNKLHKIQELILSIPLYKSTNSSTNNNNKNKIDII